MLALYPFFDFPVSSAALRAIQIFRIFRLIILIGIDDFLIDLFPTQKNNRLIEYGNIRREIMGRINQIVTLQPLTAEDFLTILDSPASPIEQISIAHNVVLEVDKDTRRQLAEDAMKSGLGCRYIRSRLQTMLDEQMFEFPDRTGYTLSISHAERKEEYAGLRY